MSTTILFLSADPRDASRLRLGEEQREISEKLRLARLRDEFLLEVRMAVRPADLSQAMLDTGPAIVHFSGHGSDLGAICLEDVNGYTQEVSAEALGALFRSFGAQTRCVVLNACYSDVQAEAIARHVAYVIGMSEEIGDAAAIAFSVGFYQAVGAGRSIEEAFELGVAQLHLRGIGEGHIPRLLRRRDLSAMHAQRRFQMPGGTLSMLRRGRTDSDDVLGRQRIGFLALAAPDIGWELAAVIEGTGGPWQSAQVTSAAAQAVRTFAETSLMSLFSSAGPIEPQPVMEMCVVMADIGVRAAVKEHELPDTVGAKMSLMFRLPTGTFVAFVGDCGALASWRHENGHVVRLVNHPRRLTFAMPVPAILSAPLGHLVLKDREGGEEANDWSDHLEVVPEHVPLEAPGDFLVLTSEGLPTSDVGRNALSADVNRYGSARNVGQFLIERDIADESVVACYELTSSVQDGLEQLPSSPQPYAGA